MKLQLIQQKIFEIRGYRVMMDFHLAELYEVENRALKQAVRRNMDRFPSDFYVPTNRKKRLTNFVTHRGITICDTPQLQYWSKLSFCIYRTRSSYVIQYSEK